MDISGNSLTPRNLTGQLSEIDYRPKFTGNYSNVYLGSLYGTPVAIKAIKATSGEDSVRRQKVLREITLWAGTNHQNIHPFYGFVNDEWFGPFGALVSPWCFNGDATEYLRRNGERMIAAERINLWRGVMEGVAYLHQHNPVIVHGDLKPGNVLIDDLGAPRICDFGLARVFLEAESTGMTTTSEHTGTARYLAPELVASEVTVYPTTASDVYALGCLGLEFMYDQKPYSNRPNNLRGQIILDIRRSVPPAAGPPIQSWTHQHAWSLINQLWSLDPRYRPSAPYAVSLLDHTARNLPPIVIQRIVLFSATFEESRDWKSRWRQRTRCLLNLLLVSRSFCACATPFLYHDIRIFPTITAAKLSSLANSLNIGVKSRYTLDDLSSGDEYCIRTFVLCICKDAHTLPADIKRLLDKMAKLQTLVFCTSDRAWEAIPTHHLSAIVFRGINPLLILDQGMLRALLSFQRLSIDPGYGPDPPIRDISQIGQAPLLPNLQAIDLQEKIVISGGCFDLGPSSGGPAFICFLRTHGPLLQYLKLDDTYYLPGATGDAPLISDILSLCINLRSLVFISLNYLYIRSFPPLLNLEILDIESKVSPLWEHREPYLDQFEEFISSWRTRLPNLRVAKFKGHEDGFRAPGGDTWLRMLFRTEDSFYTVKHGEMTYKRWEGKWIGAGTQGILVENSANAILLLSPLTQVYVAPLGAECDHILDVEEGIENE